MKNQRKPAATTQEINYMNEASNDRVEYPARNHKATSCRISKHNSRASLASFLKVRALRSFQSTYQVSMTSESKPFLLPRGTLCLAQVHQRKGDTTQQDMIQSLGGLKTHDASVIVLQPMSHPPIRGPATTM